MGLRSWATLVLAGCGTAPEAVDAAPVDPFASWTADQGDALVSLCRSFEAGAKGLRENSPRVVVLDGDRVVVGWEARQAADGPRDANAEGPLEQAPGKEGYSEAVSQMRKLGLRSMRLRSANVPAAPGAPASELRRTFSHCEMRRAEDADGAAFATPWIQVGGGPWWQLDAKGGKLPQPRADCVAVRAQPPDSVWSCRWPTPAAKVRADLLALPATALEAALTALRAAPEARRMKSLDDADGGWSWLPEADLQRSWSSGRVHSGATTWEELFPFVTGGGPWRHAPRLVHADAAPPAAGTCTAHPAAGWWVCDGPLLGTADVNDLSL